MVCRVSFPVWGLKTPHGALWDEGSRPERASRDRQESPVLVGWLLAVAAIACASLHRRFRDSGGSRSP